MAKAQAVSGLDPEEPIFACAALIVHTRLGEMLNYESYMNNVTKVYELHQMRIAAKRLRYSMEIFQPVYCDHTPYGKEFEKATEEIKALQEHLGEIHDADVLVPKLTEHLAKLLKPGYGADKHGIPFAGVHFVDFDGGQGLLTLCQNIRDERDKRYQLLLKDWARLREAKFFENLTGLLEKAAESAANPERMSEEARAAEEVKA
jgi:CHAD domain-containing protein